MKEYYADGDTTIYNGDCLQIMNALPQNSFDAVAADPPYSSGGLFRGDRAQPPQSKYATQSEYATFSGDNRDAHSWGFWSTMWITQAVRLLKEGGYFFMFTDWRQFPTASDALQAGGIIWRGVIVWDKTNSSRAPHKGYFRHQCEYILWGSKGNLKIPKVGENDGPFPGCYTYRVNPNEKLHMTAKPIELMQKILAPIPKGGAVLDPFAGSGSTGVACLREGLKFTGIEMSECYCEVSAQRLKDEFANRSATA